MKIAIRMDDITPDMDWKKFLEFKKILDENSIKPLIGVVPDNQDELLSLDEKHNDFWEYIKQLQDSGWVIAQHGLNHVYSTKKMGIFPLNKISEFAGFSFQEQYEKIKKGKEILEAHDIKTDFFMAPAHSYDRNTLRALKENGFKKVTDGFGIMPYKRYELSFYPISFRQSSSLKRKEGYTTFVFHTNMMEEQEFEKYKILFRERKNDFISYEELFSLEISNRNVLGNIKEWFLAILKYILVNLRK